VLLGDANPLDAGIFQGPLYIGVQVGSGQEMAPRQRIAPVAYAVQLTDGVYVDPTSKVGIGTTQPQAQLDVNGNVAVRGALFANGKITSLATSANDSSTTVTTKGYVDTKWPQGSYCILRSGTSCPTGFTQGHICLDTEDDNNRDRSDGNTGASQIGAQSLCGTGAAGSVRLAFCCK
jgi:hypothetical protein